MSDWILFALIFWGAFVVDAVRRPKRSRHALRAGWLGGRARWDFAALHLAPLLPWQWRVWSDDPALAFSPHGILNQSSGASGRPSESPHQALVVPWEEIQECAERDGWLLVNQHRFAPQSAAFSAASLLALARELTPLPAVAREARLRRELTRRFRPAHWRRRVLVLQARTRVVAELNTVTLVLAAALTVVACSKGFALNPALAERVMPWVPHAALLAFASWVAAIVFAFRAAKRLARWTRPGVRQSIATALLFPPQALRWRTLLAEAMHPAPHPLLHLASFARRTDLRLAAFNTFADLAHPLPLPAGAPPEAAAIRSWFTAALRPQLERVVSEAAAWKAQRGSEPPALASGSLEPESLLRAPAPDSTASCAYCPRCNDQFVRAESQCPHGIALRKLK